MKLPDRQDAVNYIDAGRQAGCVSRWARFWARWSNVRSSEHGKVVKTKDARVAELADALDLGSRGATRGGSTPPSRTIDR